MTIAKDFAAKLAIAFVAVAMVFAAYAPAANAQTTEDLQQMINDLLAQVAALQAQAGQGSSSVASGVCPYTWTRDLTMGSTGADVMKLQQFLNADADTRVAASGVGSVGMETEYYGALTAAAVSKMQVKYRAEVLSPANLVNPTGYFGPSSRAKANSVCVAAPVAPTPDEDEDEMEDEDEDEEDTTVTLGGAAVLDTVEVDDPADSTVEEGDRDVEIGTFTVDFSDGDAEIDRITVALDGTGNGEPNPWDVFRSISIWVDGDKVAEKRADRRSDYTNENAGTLRFTGLGIVAMEDEELEIVIGAEVRDVIRDLGTNGDEWELTFVDMRFFDADGVAENVTVTGANDFTTDTAVFTVEEAGEGEEITVRRASSNPASADIIVDTTSNTNDVNIFSFDIEADDGDIELRTVVVEVETPGGTTTDIIRDVELVIDGMTFRDEAVRALAGGETTGDSLNLGRSEANGTTSIWYLFDIDADIMIEDGDSVLAELVVDFRSQEVSGDDRYANGQQIRARVTSTELGFWVAEGAQDLVQGSGGDFSGSATGEYHTLLAEGLAFNVVDISERRVAGTGNSPVDTAEFTLEVEITAVEDTFFILDDGAELGFTVSRTQGGTTTVVPAASSSATMNASGVTKEGNYYRLDEGQSRTFTFTITTFPGGDAGAQFRAVFDSLEFYTDSLGAGQDTQNFIPESDYRTGAVTIIN